MSFKNGSGTTRYPYTKEYSWTPSSHHTKMNSEWITDPNIRAKIIKLF